MLLVRDVCLFVCGLGRKLFEDLVDQLRVLAREGKTVSLRQRLICIATALKPGKPAKLSLPQNELLDRCTDALNHGGKLVPRHWLLRRCRQRRPATRPAAHLHFDRARLFLLHPDAHRTMPELSDSELGKNMIYIHDVGAHVNWRL